MFFGAVPVAEALGGVAVHSIRQGDLVLKKGTLIGEAEVAALLAEGIASVVISRPAPDDVSEDAAAHAIASRISGRGVQVEAAFTGRSNLFAEHAGVLVVEADAIDRLNEVDESVTVATLQAFAAVEAGEMIGTVKIIPFAIPGEMLQASLATASQPLIRVAPYRPLKVAVVSTLLPGLKDSVIAKTLKVLADRLKPAGATITVDQRVPHDAAALAEALISPQVSLADMVIVFGASAIADRRDVIPAALEDAGGAVEHFGMPVDPGNLLLIGSLGGRPVLGAPGCARSPKENGFDWVLRRLLAEIPVRRRDITSLGVGGLLMEIVTRPQPRLGSVEDEQPNIAAVVLAGGRSTRMGGPNKLLEIWRGRPLVRITVEAALASKARSVIVVTGHQDAEIRAALAGLPVSFAYNPDFASGLSTSVRAGIAALPSGCDGALVCLADMPGVDARLLDRLIEAFEPAKGVFTVTPTYGGQRGNPVLWAKRFFGDLRRLSGDAGARSLLQSYPEGVVEVAVETDAVTLDVDTPEALAALRNRSPVG